MDKYLGKSMKTKPGKMNALQDNFLWKETGTWKGRTSSSKSIMLMSSKKHKTTEFC